MPRSAKPQGRPASGKKAKKKPLVEGAVSSVRLRELREQAKFVREQVAQDRDQIAAESREVVEEAVAAGKLTKLTLLLRQDEQYVLEALDRYASERGLRSRNQVLRAALARLLNIELDRPHWGWPPGRRRK
ncbi:MAG: hypothetical protein WD069_02915 [Planctomycetales bacterium]